MQISAKVIHYLYYKHVGKRVLLDIKEVVVHECSFPREILVAHLLQTIIDFCGDFSMGRAAFLCRMLFGAFLLEPKRVASAHITHALFSSPVFSKNLQTFNLVQRIIGQGNLEEGVGEEPFEALAKYDLQVTHTTNGQ